MMGMSDYVIDLRENAADEYVAGRLDEQDFRTALKRTGLDRDEIDGWVLAADEAIE